MTETEKKVYNYAVSVDWDYDRLRLYVNEMCNKEFQKLEGVGSYEKTDLFIAKHKHQLPESITLPIEDYNRLRKLEIKQEIKRLKKELKGL